MSEYYIIAQSFAAPFCSDESRSFIEADSPEQAINAFRDRYKHPCGLFSADCYVDANAHAKGSKPLARWLSNHQIAVERVTKGLGAYSFLGEGPGKFQVDGKWHTVENPKGVAL